MPVDHHWQRGNLNNTIMKKISLILILCTVYMYSYANTGPIADTTVVGPQANKQVLKLNVKLAKLQVDLAKVQNRMMKKR